MIYNIRNISKCNLTMIYYQMQSYLNFYKFVLRI